MMKKIDYTVRFLRLSKVCVALSCLLLYTACTQALLAPPKAKTSDQYGSLTVSVGKSGSRTVMPDLTTTWDTATVTLERSGFTTKTVTVNSPNPVTEAITGLALGNWTITVLAKKGTAVVAHGTAVKTIIAGVNDPIEIPLSFYKGTGTGTLAFSLQFPSAMADYAAAEIAGQTVTVGSITAVSGGPVSLSSTTISGTLPAGEHSIKLTFKKGGPSGKIVGVFTEAVNIWAGLESNKWIDSSAAFVDTRTFAENEFATTETALAGLAAAGLSPSFVATTMNYSICTISSTDTFTLTPSVASDGRSVKYSTNHGSTWTGLRPSNMEISLPALAAGASHTVQIMVTAADRVSNTTYTVTVKNVLPVMEDVPSGYFQRDATAANISGASTFKMGRTEVTRDLFLAVMGVDPSDPSVSSGTSDPVQNINWYHAIAFCNKLSLAATPPLEQVYSIPGVDFASLVFSDIPTESNSSWDNVSCNWNANGYRLPTEMEWMWAAMGATSDRSNGYTGVGVNTSGYQKGYAGSTEIGNAQSNIGGYAWYQVNSSGKTHPVGTRLPNECGLYDMTGNVWELCWDRVNAGPAGIVTDYYGLATGVNRVAHGGCFANVLSDCVINRQADKSPSQMSVYCKYHGFRLAQSLPRTALEFAGLSANGTSGTVTTTELTLTFSAEPVGLTANHITLTGANKGTLTNDADDASGKTWKLAISGITSNGQDVTVKVAAPVNYTITGGTQTVAVWKALLPNYAKTLTLDSNQVNILNVAPDNNENLYVAAYINDKAVLVKLDSAGQVLWRKSATGTLKSYIRDIAVYDGAVYVTGDYTGTMTFDSTSVTGTSSIQNPFVARFDSDGNLVWLKSSLSGNSYGSWCSITVGQEGVFVGGMFYNSRTFDNGVSVTANSTMDSPFVVKYNHSGVPQWAITSTVNRCSCVVSMAVDNGVLAICGYTNGANCDLQWGNLPNLRGPGYNFNGFVAAFDAGTGTARWNALAPATGTSHFTGIAIKDGAVYASGYNDPRTNILYENDQNTGLLVKYSVTDGSIVWQNNTVSLGLRVEKVQIDNSGIYTVGFQKTGTFLQAIFQKHDMTGTVLSTKKVSGSSDSRYGYFRIDTQSAYMIGFQKTTSAYTYDDVSTPVQGTADADNCVIVRYAK